MPRGSTPETFYLGEEQLTQRPGWKKRSCLVCRVAGFDIWTVAGCLGSDIRMNGLIASVIWRMQDIQLMVASSPDASRLDGGYRRNRGAAAI
jgi:hypothetical protein